MEVLDAHVNLVEQIYTKYKKSSLIMSGMETLYVQEQKALTTYKQRVTKNKIQADEISTHACNIQNELDKFEKQYDQLCKELRSLTCKFTDDKDRKDYDNKINEFCFLYRERYNNIDDIRFDQQQLVKRIGKK